MTENKKTDQWLSEGKCQECRRNNYCKKPCTKSKRRTRAVLNQMLVNSIKGAREKMQE